MSARHREAARDLLANRRRPCSRNFANVTAEARCSVGHGGVDYARAYAHQRVRPGGKQETPGAASQPHPATTTMLQRVDPQLLARFVRSEHPQTVALILSHLSAGAIGGGAGVDGSGGARGPGGADRAPGSDLARGDRQDFRGDRQKLKSLGEVKRESSGGPRAVAEIFNQLDTR